VSRNLSSGPTSHPNLRPKRQRLSGWGRYPATVNNVVRPERFAQLVPQSNSVIARGKGRSYGDAALNSEGDVILSERINRFISFDEATGLLRAEAGVTLADVLAVFVPRGWFLPVTPGTKHCSLGGCVAADVHGKNHHHSGTLGAHVREIELVMADESRERCSPDSNADLFWATIGGMGLTGIITEIVFQLIPITSSRIAVQHRKAETLDTALDLLADTDHDDQYTVAWIDCLSSGKQLGRSILMTGHHATRDELGSAERDPLSVKQGRQLGLPFNLPTSVLNFQTIRAFNNIYYARQGSRGQFITDYDRFFYPLDAISNWNRMYGSKGFVQYQFVLPTDGVKEGMRVSLELLAASKKPSFLAVLKRFGAEGSGYLSFPTKGYTLALDMPLSSGLFQLLDRLDEIVLHYGGRVYLAKDARLNREAFETMYPRLPDWMQVRDRVDPNKKFRSDLSRRLGL
jgi:decaprenylphospho-beta-D-ribofuranose 2-oxidase